MGQPGLKLEPIWDASAAHSSFTHYATEFLLFSIMEVYDNYIYSGYNVPFIQVWYWKHSQHSYYGESEILLNLESNKLNCHGS